MKKLGLLLLTFSFFFFSCEKKQGTDKTVSGENSQKIISTFVLGKVFVKGAQSDKWEQVKVGRYFKINDTVKVSANSKIQFQTETGSVFVLKELSEMKLNSALDSKTQTETTVLELNNGSVSVKPRKLDKDSKFYVRTPALVAGVRGTQFAVGHEGGNSKISVVEGTVAVKPSLNNEKTEETIQPVSVTQGQKVELDAKVAAAISKQIAEKEFKDQDSISSKTILVAPFTQKEKDKEDLSVLDIDMNLSKMTLVPLTVSSYGNEIFVNSIRVGRDYYSALYPVSKELDVAVKKSKETLYQKKHTLPNEGIEIILTPEAIINQENQKAVSQVLDYSYKKVGENFPASIQKMISSESLYVFEKNSQIKVFEGNQQKNELAFDPKVKPAYSADRIFTYGMNQLNVYQSNGNKVGSQKLNNIIFQNAITVFDGVAYLSNSIGNLIGVNSEGKTVFEYSVKEAIVSPAVVNSNYLVIASPYNAYVIDYKNNKLVSVFRLGNAKVFKKIGLMKDRLIIPLESNVIQITDINGKLIKSIIAVPGNIEVLNDSLFAVKYYKKMVVFNLAGEIVKEVNYNPNAVFTVSNQLIYAEGDYLYVDNLSTEKKIHMPDEIELVTKKGNMILVLCKNGAIYEVAE